LCFAFTQLRLYSGQLACRMFFIWRSNAPNNFEARKAK
jgi:hypothetical protein